MTGRTVGGFRTSTRCPWSSASFDAGLAAGVLRLTGKGTTPATGKFGVTQQTQAIARSAHIRARSK
ncbi:MAG: hypothetical protein WDN29_08155 [Methylovirgula sp.]